MNTKAPSAHSLLAEFLAYLASKGSSVLTCEAYSRDLREFLDYSSLRDWNLHDLTLKELRDFLAHLRGRSLSTRTIARRLTSLKQFLAFLVREEKIQTDPSELLTITVKKRTLPAILSEDEVVRLITRATGSTWEGTRDRALFEFWYATGCRVSELVGLETNAFDWKGRTVRLMGKGRRERILPLTTIALEWCQRFRELRHERLAQVSRVEQPVFFVSQNGRALSRQGVWKLVRRYGEEAGLGKRVWPHLIRHTFATHVLKGGADLRVVQELLGHRSISTTEIYTHLDKENLKEMQIKFHPRS